MHSSVRRLGTATVANLRHQTQPLRLQYEVFSDQNPAMASVAALAEQVRETRKSPAGDNPFIAMQEKFSDQIIAALDLWRQASEALSERMFLAIYGSSTLQTAVGVDPASTQRLRKAPKNPLHREPLQKRLIELKART